VECRKRNVNRAVCTRDQHASVTSESERRGFRDECTKGAEETERMKGLRPKTDSCYCCGHAELCC
jgi:hypothetical protein